MKEMNKKLMNEDRKNKCLLCNAPVWDQRYKYCENCRNTRKEEIYFTEEYYN